jgi:hypothetical protein
MSVDIIISNSFSKRTNMQENIMLTVFIVFPILTGLLLYLFSKTTPYFKKAQWLRWIIGNIMVFVLLVSIVILCGEVYYRFIYDTTDSFGLTKTSIEWHKRHYNFNNYHVRDSINYTPKLSGKPRITFVGDSFTAGHGINDIENRFVNRIRKTRPKLEIHAIADNGWDTYKQFATLLKLSQQGYQFDTVVLVYVLNDISDLIPKWKQVIERIYYVEPGFIFEHSYFLNTLYYRFYVTIDPDISSYYSFVIDAYDGPVWQDHIKMLKSIKHGFDVRNVDFYVVTFPFIQALGKDYKYRDIHNKLGQFWNSLGAKHLDLLDIFETCPAKDLVVNKFDAHPNQQAHAMAAEAIIEFLETHNIKIKQNKDP